MTIPSDDVEVQEEESNVTTNCGTNDDGDRIHQRSDPQPSMMINLDTIKRRLFHRRNNTNALNSTNLRHPQHDNQFNDDDEKTYSSTSIGRFFLLLCLRVYRWLSSPPSLLCCSHRKVRHFLLLSRRVDNLTKKKKFLMLSLILIITTIIIVIAGQRVIRSIRRYRRKSVDPSVIRWSYPHVPISNKTMLSNSSSTITSYSYDEYAIDITKIKNHNHNHNYGIDNKRVIFVLSMGQDASKSTIVERCLLSIRRRGEYLGYVVLLTDAPYSRYQRLQNYDQNFIVLHPYTQADWNWKLRNDMPYKRFKTYILDYIDNDSKFDSVQLVYYIDIDIVIGKPLMHMFHYLESKYNITETMSNVVEARTKSGTISTPSHVYFFKGNYPWRPLQGGQFILIRYNSDYCLHKWRYYIDEHPEDDKDQSALTLLLNESLKQEAMSMSARVDLHGKNTTATNTIGRNHGHQQHCHFTTMEQYPHLQFVNETTMIDLTTKIPPENFPTMIHIKNTEHGHWISNDIQQKFFQKILNITSRKELYYIGGKTRIQPSNKQWSMT